MKAVRAMSWIIIGITSIVGAFEIAERVDRIGQDCRETVGITEFLRSTWQTETAINYDGETDTWYGEGGRVIGTAVTEDSDVCLK